MRKQRYNRARSKEKRAGTQSSPFLHSVISQSQIHRHGNQCKSSFFESTLEGVFVEIVAIQIQVIAP